MQPTRLGQISSTCPLCHHEHCQHQHRLLTFPTPDGSVAALDSLTYTGKDHRHVPEADAAIALIEHLSLDVMEAQDNLLAAKVVQAEFANWHRGDEHTFAIRDKVMLSMKHR